MALVEGQSTTTVSVADIGSVEGRGSSSVLHSIPSLHSVRKQKSWRRERGQRGDSQPSSGGRFQRLVEQARANVWTPVLLRAFGVLFGMLGLAGIGAFATAKGVSGHAVPPGSSAVPGWEKPKLGASKVESAAVTPGVGEPSPRQRAWATAPEVKPSSPALTEDGKVILNLATADDLMRLPGIGRKRAESILALREKLGGRFRRFADLLRIRGIGPRRLKQMTPLMVLDPPSAPPTPAPTGSATK